MLFDIISFSVTALLALPILIYAYYIIRKFINDLDHSPIYKSRRAAYNFNNKNIDKVKGALPNAKRTYEKSCDDCGNDSVFKSEHIRLIEYHVEDTLFVEYWNVFYMCSKCDHKSVNKVKREKTPWEKFPEGSRVPKNSHHKYYEHYIDINILIADCEHHGLDVPVQRERERKLKNKGYTNQKWVRNTRYKCLLCHSISAKLVGERHPKHPQNYPWHPERHKML